MHGRNDDEVDLRGEWEGFLEAAREGCALVVEAIFCERWVVDCVVFCDVWVLLTRFLSLNEKQYTVDGLRMADEDDCWCHFVVVEKEGILKDLKYDQYRMIQIIERSSHSEE